MLLKEIQGSESPEEEVYILEIIVLLFLSERHYADSKARTRGIRDLTVVENTHLALRCGNGNVYFLQTLTV